MSVFCTTPPLDTPSDTANIDKTMNMEAQQQEDSPGSSPVAPPTLSLSSYVDHFEADIRSLSSDQYDILETIIQGYEESLALDASPPPPPPPPANLHRQFISADNHHWSPSISYRYYDVCYWTYAKFIRPQTQPQTYAIVASNGMGYTVYALYKARSERIYLVQVNVQTVQFVYEMSAEKMPWSQVDLIETTENLTTTVDLDTTPPNPSTTSASASSMDPPYDFLDERPTPSSEIV